jgi:hypothetical protein
MAVEVTYGIITTTITLFFLKLRIYLNVVPYIDGMTVILTTYISVRWYP